jgi:hypothetical protein
MVELLWRMRLSNRHYYIYSKLNFPDTVLQGPFKGMKYLPSSVGSWILAKYLGTYEKELWVAIENICQHHCDVFVDVGSAEGYYAIGMTIRLMPERTHCFDINPRAHRLLGRIAKRNQLSEKIKKHLDCSVVNFEKVLHDATRPVVIMDCEGSEDELLDPQSAPSLLKATILVELHESLRPGITQRIEHRFSKTHRVERLQSVERSLNDLPPNLMLSEEDAVFGMSEGRTTTMEWFVMTPDKVFKAQSWQ